MKQQSELPYLKNLRPNHGRIGNYHTDGDYEAANNYNNNQSGYGSPKAKQIL